MAAIKRPQEQGVDSAGTGTEVAWQITDDMAPRPKNQTAGVDLVVSPRLTPQERELRAISEKAWVRSILESAQSFGWVLLQRAWSSQHSPSGWPDLTLARPPRIIFVEAKAERGKLSERQEQTLNVLRKCGQEVFVWRPSDQVEVIDCFSDGKVIRPSDESGT